MMLPTYLAQPSAEYRLKKAKKLSLSDYTTPDGIIRFTRDILGAKPTPYQEEILYNFVKHRRAAVRGPHGLGKTALSSWVILWGATVWAEDIDAKVVTTASAWRQLIHYTWPEVHKWARTAKWDKLGLEIRTGKELLIQSLKVGNKQAFPVATDDPAYIEGAHAKRLIYVFDEAKAIPVGIWDAAEGAFSTAGDDTSDIAYALAISTPGDTSGRFYDIHQRKPGYEDWWTRHVKLEEAVAAGRISQNWADDRKRQWGEESAIYKQRVLGDFDDSGEDSVIPLSWVEKAHERWQEREGKGTGDISYGLDVARYGADKTSFGRLVGNTLEWIKTWGKQNTMQTVGRVTAEIGTDYGTPIGTDVIGVGAGVHDRLVELGYKSIAVNVANKTDMKDMASGKIGFVNLRSAIWWLIREMLDPDYADPLALPPDDTLTGDLTTPRYDYTSDGKIKVESKDDLRERLGRSTDAADMLGLALYARVAPYHSWGVWEV